MQEQSGNKDSKMHEEKIKAKNSADAIPDEKLNTKGETSPQRNAN